MSWAESTVMSAMGTMLLLMSLWITSGWASHWGRTLCTCKHRNKHDGYLWLQQEENQWYWWLMSLQMKWLHLLDRFVLKSTKNCESCWRRGLLWCIIFCLCLFCSSCVHQFISAFRWITWNQKTDRLNNLRHIFIMQMVWAYHSITRARTSCNSLR